MHTNCVRCGHHLRAERSQRLGMSVACLATTGRVLADLNASRAQVAKVGVALDLGMAVKVAPALYRVQSATSGGVSYIVTPVSCTCPAANHGRRCHHVLTVRVLEARP